MKLNKKSLLFVLLLGIIFSVSFVSAASGASSSNVTIVLPGVAGTLTETAYVFNCSMHAGYEEENYTTGYIYMKSASTANSSWATMKDAFDNTTAVDFNGTLDSSAVEDANDYIFNCTLWNGTDYISATRTGLTIDNTVPTAASSLSPSNNIIDTDGTVNFTGTATDSETISCTLNFVGTNPGYSSYIGVYSTTSCSYQLTAIPEQTYNWYITLSDGTNTTKSTVYTVNIDSTSGTRRINQQQQRESIRFLALRDADGSLSNTSIVLIVIGAIALVYIVLVRRK